MQPGQPQPAGAASSPYSYLLGGQIGDGQYVSLKPGAYDPGVGSASVMAINPNAPTGQKILRIDISAHHVELVGGVSGGKKLGELHATFAGDAKVNEPDGFGVYGVRDLEVDSVGNALTIEVCCNDGKKDAQGNPTLLWQYATISLANTPLSGIKAFTDQTLVALLAALLGGGGSGGADPNAIHDGDTVKIVRV